MDNFNIQEFEDPIDAFSQRMTRLSEKPEVDSDAFSQRITRLTETQRVDVDAFSERATRLSEERPYRPDPGLVDAVERRRAFTVAAQQNYGLDSEAAEELYRAHQEGRKMGFWETGWHTLKEKIDPVLHAEAGRNIVAASRLSKTRYGREIDIADKDSVIKGGMKAAGIFSIKIPPTTEEIQTTLDAGFSERVARMMPLNQAKTFYARGLKEHRKAEKYAQSARYQQDLKDVDKYFRHQGRLAAERELRGQTTMGKIGGGLSDTAIFMVELYATGGLGGIVSAEAKIGAKMAIKNLLKSAVSPERIVASAARATIMPSTWTEAMAKASPHLSADKKGDITLKKEGMPYFEAISGSVIDKAIAVHAEKMGAEFGAVGSSILRKFPTGRKLLAGLHKAFRKKHPGGSPQAFAKEFFKRAEFHGFVSESLEERAEDFMRWGLGRQENLLPSLEEWGIELGVLGILKGGQVSLTAGSVTLEAMEEKFERETATKFEAMEKAVAAEPDYARAGEAVEAAAVELAARHKADFTYTPDKPLLLSDLVADKGFPDVTEEAAIGLLKAHGIPSEVSLDDIQVLGYNKSGKAILGTKDEIAIAQGGSVYTVVEEVFESNFKKMEQDKKNALLRDLKSYELVNGKLSEGSVLERLSDLAKAAAFDARLHRKLGFKLKEIVRQIRVFISATIRHARILRQQVKAGNVSESFLKKIEDVTYQRAIDQQLETIAGQIQQVGVEPEIKAEIGEAAEIVAKPEVAKPEVAKPEVAKPEAVVQPWEMTFNKFIESPIGQRPYYKYEMGHKAQHKGFIQDALKEGKLVPAEVLQEYKGEKWADEALEKPAIKESLTVEKPVANVFVRMPTDILETQAKQGVAGAKAELERRKVDGELSASIVRILPTTKAIMHKAKAFSKRGKVLHNTLAGVKRFGSLMSDLMTPISTALGRIAISLKRRLRRFEYDYRQAVKKDVIKVTPFMTKAYNLKEKDWRELDSALKHANTTKINRLVAKHNMQKEYQAAREVLNTIHTKLKAVGIDVGFLESFMPRAVKDVDALRDFLAESKTGGYWSAFEKALAEKERKLGKKFTANERTEYINQLIRGYGTNRIALSGQGHTKARVIEKITPELDEFYYDSGIALVQYIQRMHETIEARKMFGKGIGVDIDEPIGEYVKRLIEHKIIRPTQERSVVELLTARFTSKPPRKIIKQYRNFEYLETLTSVVVSLSQLDDLGIAWYRGGLITGLPKTLMNAGRAALNKSEMTLVDVGVTEISAEMTDPEQIHKVLDFALKLTGFKYLDRVGKETTLNTIMQTYRKQAKNPSRSFRRRIRLVFGIRANEVIQKMRDGVVDDDIQYLAFNELLDIQPVAMSEMPKKYLQMSDGKMWYILKSFMLRRLDFVLNETIYLMKTNPVEGILNSVRLCATLMIMGVSVEELKDWILGRQTSLKDQSTDALLQIAGLSKYNIYDAKARGGWKAMFNQIAPPFKIVDSGGRDIRDLMTGKYKGSESLSSIPVVGKILYWRYGKGYQKDKKRRIRERPKTIGKILRKRIGPKKERTGARRRIG